jgi:alpha-beta hydrolase superfamily lysophospholipase
MIKGEFARAITSDGLELVGLWASPQGGSPKTAVLHVHGLAGNFYENRFVDAAAAAATGAGLGFLTVNNRGHEYISDSICQASDGTTGSRQIGGAYEIFEDCAKDIQAWVDFLKGCGVETIILQGHSHGALKVTHYWAHAHTREHGLKGLILLSPSDDFGMQRYRMGRRFDEIVGIARNLVAEGRGTEFMSHDYHPYLMSAQTYYDTFRPESHLKIFNISMTDTHTYHELEKVKAPVLLIVGSVEESFIGRPDEFLADVKRRFKGTKDFTGHVIDGAPHSYLGHEGEVGRHIGEWLTAHFKA